MFEKQTGSDISAFIYKVEKAAYAEIELADADKILALKDYKIIKKIIRTKVPKKTKYIP